MGSALERLPDEILLRAVERLELVGFAAVRRASKRMRSVSRGARLGSIGLGDQSVRVHAGVERERAAAFERALARGDFAGVGRLAVGYADPFARVLALDAAARAGLRPTEFALSVHDAGALAAAAAVAAPATRDARRVELTVQDLLGPSDEHLTGPLARAFSSATSLSLAMPFRDPDPPRLLRSILRAFPAVEELTLSAPNARASLPALEVLGRLRALRLSSDAYGSLPGEPDSLGPFLPRATRDALERIAISGVNDVRTPFSIADEIPALTNLKECAFDVLRVGTSERALSRCVRLGPIVARSLNIYVGDWTDGEVLDALARWLETIALTDGASLSVSYPFEITSIARMLTTLRFGRIPLKYERWGPLLCVEDAPRELELLLGDGSGPRRARVTYRVWRAEAATARAALERVREIVAARPLPLEVRMFCDEPRTLDSVRTDVLDLLRTWPASVKEVGVVTHRYLFEFKVE